MSKEGIYYLGDALDKAVEYCRKEFEMTYAEAVGLLLFKAHAMMNEAECEEDDTY